MIVDCVNCGRGVSADTEEEYEKHVNSCPHGTVTREEFEKVAQQVAEIHEFCQSLATALKGLEQNPMLRTMLGL